MQTPIAMRNDIDCGRIAASNHVANILDLDPETLYQKTAALNQPTRWPRCDFWDSPSRGLQMVEMLSGKKAGLVPLPVACPSVVLLKLSALAWHWVTVYGVSKLGIVWHDGRAIRTIPFETRFPGCKVIMAYAIGGVIPLPWYWRVWNSFTRLFC